MFQFRLLTALATTSFAVPSAASACSFELRHYSDQEVKQMAEQAVAEATTIVDGEVVSPMYFGSQLPEGALSAAYIKVSRALKGKVEEGGFATVAYSTSCDIGLETKGQKFRILLSGVGIFTASQFINGAQAGDKTELFNREVDRILGSDRPSDFVEPGMVEPPPEEK